MTRYFQVIAFVALVLLAPGGLFVFAGILYAHLRDKKRREAFRKLVEQHLRIVK